MKNAYLHAGVGVTRQVSVVPVGNIVQYFPQEDDIGRPAMT